MVKAQTTEERILALNDAQVKQLLGRLMLDLDEESAPTLDVAELQERVSKDRELLQAAASKLRLSAATDDTAADVNGAKNFLAAVASVSPQHTGMIESALREVESAPPKLDFGVSVFAINFLVLAVSGAIVRPSIEWTSDTSPGGAIKKRFSFKLQGIKDIEKVIKTLLPFLR